jgi:hypothetical protein
VEEEDFFISKKSFSHACEYRGFDFLLLLLAAATYYFDF